jgi:hypothetical protein
VSDDDGEYMGSVTCWGCGGRGSIVTCMDDLCRNGDGCMHGDGEEMCPECKGDGDL